MILAVITPDTTSFLVLGLVAFFGLLLLFLATMVVRARSLRKDEDLIEQLSDEQ